MRKNIFVLTSVMIASSLIPSLAFAVASRTADATGTVTITAPLIISNSLTPVSGLETDMATGTKVADGAVGGLNGQYLAAFVKWTDQTTTDSTDKSIATINGARFQLSLPSSIGGLSIGDGGPQSSYLTSAGVTGQGYMQIPRTNGAFTGPYAVYYKDGTLTAGNYVLKTTAIAVKA